MAKKDVDIMFEIILEPCYEVYMREKCTALMRLHALWQDARNGWCSDSTAKVIQNWHNLMALVQIFRERGEWDDEKSAPKPFFQQPEPKNQIKCHNCSCNCTWDDDAWALWDGLCPACGAVLDVLKTKEAV